MRLDSIDVPKGVQQPAVWRAALRYQFIYSLAGLVLGLLCILTGAALTLSGIAGRTTWTTHFFAVSSQLNDATPGVILFVVGVFVIIATRFRVQVGHAKDGHT